VETKTGLVRSIQWLRAIAALAVVELHSAVVLKKYGVQIDFGADDQGGRAGVNLFFVISGFVIYTMTSRHEGRLGQTLEFWRRRAIRIVPMYWLMTAITVAIAVFAPTLTEYRVGLQHVVASMLFVPWPDLRGNFAPPLRVGWSLDYEVYFYLVFGLMLLVRRQNLIRLVLLWGLLSVLAGAVLKPQTALGQMLTSNLLLEFVGGIVIAYAWRQGLMLSARAALLTSILGAVLLFVALGWGRAFDEAFKFGVPSLLLLAGAVGLEAKGAYRFRSRPMLALGDWSYAIYLTHLYSIAAFGQLLRAAHLAGAVPGAIVVASSVAFAAIVGGVVHHLLELPMQRALSTEGQSR